MRKLTRALSGRVARASGDCAVTVPFLRREKTVCVPPSVQFAASIATRAAASVLPTTFGTTQCTGGGEATGVSSVVVAVVVTAAAVVVSRVVVVAGAVVIGGVVVAAVVGSDLPQTKPKPHWSPSNVTS